MQYKEKKKKKRKREGKKGYTHIPLQYTCTPAAKKRERERSKFERPLPDQTMIVSHLLCMMTTRGGPCKMTPK
jgi:hypothetical protein